MTATVPVRLPKQPANGITLKVDRSLCQWHWLEQSLLFCELSRLTYFPESLVKPIFEDAGITDCQFIDREGAQAYILGNKHDLMILCRGTEPHDWNDLRADANAMTVLFDVGRLHAGFKSEVDELWPIIERVIRENQRPTWFAGHSLGGAMSTICAGRCKLSSIPSNPRALFTYGSPRVGNSAFINAVKLAHYRWVNNNDIVTRIPPRWLGYRHSGFELYCDHRNRLRKVYSWQRSMDRFRGLWQGLFRGSLDYLSDHSNLEYIRILRGLLTDFRSGKRSIEPRVRIDE